MKSYEKIGWRLLIDKVSESLELVLNGYDAINNFGETIAIRLIVMAARNTGGGCSGSLEYIRVMCTSNLDLLKCDVEATQQQEHSIYIYLIMNRNPR